MQRAVITLGICTVLLAAGVAYGAALRTDFIWDGSNDSAWDNPQNWTAGSSYPGDPTAGGCDDTATIDESQSPKYWPQLQGNICVTVYMMSDDSTLDTNSQTLEVNTQFLVNNRSGAAAVTISGGGTVDAVQVRIEGGANGSTLTVSSGTTVYAR